jgi:hypothetical protein
VGGGGGLAVAWGHGGHRCYAVVGLSDALHHPRTPVRKQDGTAMRARLSRLCEFDHWSLRFASSRRAWGKSRRHGPCRRQGIRGVMCDWMRHARWRYHFNKRNHEQPVA